MEEKEYFFMRADAGLSKLRKISCDCKKEKNNEQKNQYQH